MGLVLIEADRVPVSPSVSPRGPATGEAERVPRVPPPKGGPGLAHDVEATAPAACCGTRPPGGTRIIEISEF